MGQKEKSLAQECNPGDQEGRYEGKDSICPIPGNRNSQQKLENHLRVGPDES